MFLLSKYGFLPCPIRKMRKGVDEIVYTKSLFLSNSLCERFSKNYFAANQEMHTSLPFVNDMLKNHWKCPYWTLLKHFCPSLVEINTETSLSQRNKCRKVSTNKLLENCSTVHDIHRYLCLISKKVIPQYALGSKQNFKCFMKHIKKLISVQIHGQISLNHMVNGIKTKPIAWLQSYSQKEKESMLKKAIHFLVTRFICPLIQSFFYVSESTTNKNKLFFYRKKTWHRLSQVASSKFLLACKLKKVSEQWVLTKLQETKCLGITSVRFLVKSTSLRPIVNLSFRKKNKVSINNHLMCLLRVLTFEKENHQEEFGATLMSVQDIHTRWSQFVAQCKQKRVKKLYFVKTDIEKCYDTINPCLLYSIISRIVSRSSYKIYKYKKIYHKDGVLKSAYFESFLHPKVVCTNKNRLVEHYGHYEVQRDVLLGKLCAHLFCNVIKLGRQHYVQTLGISQGSVLSSILCGAYYGYMEQTILNRIRSKLDLLVRIVDDMLYVTPCKRSAQSFLKIMIEGIPEFNCRCNFSKCCINFHYHHTVFGDVTKIADKSPIRYCGLAFDTETLNVRLDFSNYAHVQTHETLSWKLSKHPGSSLRKTMLSSVHPKCLSILFDKNINNEDSIYYNILSIFCVCAVKFHCLVMQLPPKRRALNNPTFFAKIIFDLPQEMLPPLLRKMKKLTLDIPVSIEVVSGLCFQAFQFVLRKYHVMYAPVIEKLKQKTAWSKQDDHVSSILTQVFTDIHLK